MYLYSGFDLFSHPTAWVWALPPWFSQAVGSIVPIETYLKFQGIVEIVMALLFLLWFLPKIGLQIAAFISSAELLFILLFAPFSQFLITFRDIGVLGASLALFLISLQKHGPPTPTQQI